MTNETIRSFDTAFGNQRGIVRHCSVLCFGTVDNVLALRERENRLLYTRNLQKKFKNGIKNEYKGENIIYLLFLNRVHKWHLQLIDSETKHPKPKNI